MPIGSLFSVDLTAYAQRLVARLFGLYQAHDRIEAGVEGESVAVDLERAVPCGLVLNELIANVCKHGFPEGGHGTLKVRLCQEDAEIRLTVQHNGIDMPPGFDFSKSASRGLKIVRLLAGQLRGAVTSRNGRGPSF